jgi:hypothetical protein
MEDSGGLSDVSSRDDLRRELEAKIKDCEERSRDEMRRLDSRLDNTVTKSSFKWFLQISIPVLAGLFITLAGALIGIFFRMNGQITTIQTILKIPH